MRIGDNPQRNLPIMATEFNHQVIIPVYIPNFEGYYSNSFEVLQLCLESLFISIHPKTFVTIVNNGSCEEVKIYLENLFISNKINELIHTTNIGKLNNHFNLT